MTGAGQQDLELDRWGLRFARDATEDAFREWRMARTRAVARVNWAATGLLWLSMWSTLAFISPALASELALVAVWVMGSCLLGLGVLPRGSRRVVERLAVYTQFVGAISGAIAVRAVARMDGGAFELEGAVFGTLLVFGTARWGFGWVTIAGAIMPAVAQFDRSMTYAAHGVSLGAFVLETTLLWCVMLMGLAFARSADSDARIGFRQERIIESQRETIAKQQALLQRELSHQVAERSRELGAVLAKSDVTLDVRALREGERFAERYRILSPLGAGGMGAVYEVERVTDAARLALKCVVGEVSGASAARFAREAEIGARVRHPNLVSIVDVGVASGVPYLVMELVRGGSLESQRSRFGESAWALPILEQITQGLTALHDAGVVHRDLKPANVLLTESGAKISDFGISRFGAVQDAAIDASADTLSATPKRASALTATNMVMGTPLYMAPEGAKTAKALDASADVFALGIIAYEMLVGTAPYAVPAFMLAMSGQPIPTPSVAGLPAPLRTIIASALAGEPSARPRIREIRAAIDAARR